MERISRRQLVLFFLFLAASSATALEPGTSPYCGPRFLAEMASDCVGGLEKPRLPCCVMVMATVGMGFDDKVPCICLVVREPAFLATGLNIYDIFSLYPVCQGVLPVGPDTPDPCKGWASLLYMLFNFLFDNNICLCPLCACLLLLLDCQSTAGGYGDDLFKKTLSFPGQLRE